jgi:hypothetical protein
MEIWLAKAIFLAVSVLALGIIFRITADMFKRRSR